MRTRHGTLAGALSGALADAAPYDPPSCYARLSKVPAYAPYCQKLLSKGALSATRGKQETTDHPPIYPTAPADPDSLDPAQWKLYNLIARRFLATLSESAITENTKVTFDVNSEPFDTSGVITQKPGFRAIYPYGRKKDVQLPPLEQGQTVDLLNWSDLWISLQHGVYFMTLKQVRQ